jgi:hypothetical protein
MEGKSSVELFREGGEGEGASAPRPSSHPLMPQCNTYRLISTAPKSHPATITAKTLKITNMVRVLGIRKLLLVLRSVRRQGIGRCTTRRARALGFHKMGRIVRDPVKRERHFGEEASEGTDDADPFG